MFHDCFGKLVWGQRQRGENTIRKIGISILSSEVDSVEDICRRLKPDFPDVTVLDLNESISDHQLDGVTHWITNPAPRQKITSELVAKHLPNLKVIGSPSTGTSHLSADLLKGTAVEVYCLRDLNPAEIQRITSSSEHTFFLFLSHILKVYHKLIYFLYNWFFQTFLILFPNKDTIIFLIFF